MNRSTCALASVLVAPVARYSTRPSPIRHRLNDVEKDRGQEDAEGGDSEHAVEDGGAEGVTHLGSGTFAEHQWDHADDEGERGH